MIQRYGGKGKGERTKKLEGIQLTRGRGGGWNRFARGDSDYSDDSGYRVGWGWGEKYLSLGLGKGGCTFVITKTKQKQDKEQRYGSGLG